MNSGVYGCNSRSRQNQNCYSLFHNIYLTIQFDAVAWQNIITSALLFCKRSGCIGFQQGVSYLYFGLELEQGGNDYEVFGVHSLSNMRALGLVAQQLEQATGIQVDHLPLLPKLRSARL